MSLLDNLDSEKARRLYDDNVREKGTSEVGTVLDIAPGVFVGPALPDSQPPKVDAANPFDRPIVNLSDADNDFMGSERPVPFADVMPADEAMRVFGERRKAVDQSFEAELGGLGQTLHTLRNSLNMRSPAELKALAAQSGLQPSIVDDDPAFARKKVESDSYAQNISASLEKFTNPSMVTLTYLKDADALDQLALAADTNLMALEKEIAAKHQGFFDTGLIGSARHGFDYGMIARERNELQAQKLEGSIFDEATEQRLRILKDVTAHGAKIYDSMPLEQQIPWAGVGSVGVPGLGMLYGGAKNVFSPAGAVMIGSGAAMGGMAGGGVLSIPGAISGGLAGTGAAMTAGAYMDIARQEAGNMLTTLEDMTDDAGNEIDPDIIRFLSVAYGGFAGAAEMYGLASVAKIFPGAAKLLSPKVAEASLAFLQKNPTLRAKLGDTVVHTAKGLAGEIATENMQEVGAVITESIALSTSNVNQAYTGVGGTLERMWGTTKETTKGMALFAGAGGGARLARNMRAQGKFDNAMSQIADYQASMMDSIAKTAQQSTVFKEMPETAQSLVQALADGGKVPGNIYLKPESAQAFFYQEENPDLMQDAEAMGITPEALEESLTLGTDIIVPTQLAATHIMQDAARYETLKPDMRFDPAMPTITDSAALAVMVKDAGQRNAYLESFLAPYIEEENKALNRHEERMAIAAPYVEQLQQAGYPQAKAQAYGTVIAANAERMAPVFGMTPAEYLEKRLAGFMTMTLQEFMGLGHGGLEDLEANRAYSQLMEDMGAKKGMGRVQKRRALQPEFAYAWGKVNPESFANTYGKDSYLEARQQFGPGFFARKGQGVGIDVLAHDFSSEQRGGHGLNRNDIDVDAFAEKVMMPHDEFEGSLRQSLGLGVLWQPKNAGVDLDTPVKVVTVQPRFAGKKLWEMVKSNGRNALRDSITGVYINENTGWTIKLTGNGAEHAISSAAKRGVGGMPHIEAVANLPELIKNAALVESHEDGKKQGLAAVHRMYVPMSLDEDMYVVKLTVKESAEGMVAAIEDVRKLYDVSLEKKMPGDLRLPPDLAVASGSAGSNPGISEITLRSLLADVNDSEGNRFFQPAYHGSPHRFDKFMLDHIGMGEGAQAYGWGLYFAGNKEVAESYRENLSTSTFFEGDRRLSGNEAWAAQFLMSESGVRLSTEEAIAEARRMSRPGPVQDEVVSHIRNLGDKDISEKNGQLYKVDIPEDDVLLLWERPLSEQQGDVKNILDKNGNELEHLGAWGDARRTGREVYNAISTSLGSDRAASEYLNSIGIKGLKYLDGASRSAGEGSYNYVIFDDAAIDVLQTYYQSSPEVLFHADSAKPRGGIRQMADGRYIVGLFKKADASTILHETAHFWLEELREASKLETAPEWVGEAWGKLQKAYDFEGLVDGKDGKSVAAWTNIQERFAREFEAYAREGKAPSWELQSAFNKFRNWLTEIYRTVRNLLGDDGVSEQAREVFDTLLATQEEIELSQRRASGDSVMDLLGDTVKPELRDRYAQAAQRAYDNASALIANRRLVEQRKAVREFREQATALVDSDPTYQMLKALREDGIDFEDVKQAVSEDMAYRLREKWKGARGEGKGLIRKGGTLDLLDVAAQFNEDSVAGLAAALTDTPTRREAIDAEMQRNLEQWNSEYDAEVEYSNAMDEALAIELEALTGRKQTSPASLRREFDLLVDAKKLSELDPQYKSLKARLRQDARVAREAFRAGKKEANEKGKSNMDKLRAKLTEVRETERLRRAALGAAYRARMERDHIIKQLRKDASSKSVNDAYKQQVLRILSNWKGLGTESMVPRDPVGMQSFKDFVASSVSLFDDPATFAPTFIENGSEGRAGDLTLEQLREVRRIVKELTHQGRVHNRMLANREKTEIAVVAGKCAKQMDTLSTKKFLSDREGILGTIQGALRKGLSSLTSVRFMARALDGFTDHGPNHDAWLFPLQEARSLEMLHTRNVDEMLKDAMQPIVQAGKLTTAFTIDGVALPKDVSRLWKGLWDMDKVYSVALNMGNAGNLKALMRGYGWSEQDLHTITSRLTEAEWRAIEKTWDAIDSVYPLLNETVSALKGSPLAKVEAQPFTVRTADGKVITVKGGYYPLIFDHRLSNRAAEQITTDELLNGMEAVLRRPNPQSGMTNERKGGTLPPSLTLNVIDKHVRESIHYATHALPLRDTMRLFSNADFKEAFIQSAGVENYEQLLPWLRGIARPDGERLTGMTAALDWLARRGTMYALGANMKTALLQLTSIGNSWSEVGTGNFFTAASTILSSPMLSIQTIREKSAYMHERAKLMDDTLRREYERMRASGVAGVRFMNVNYALDTVQRAQFALIASLDATVAFPTWLAAYDKAINQGVEESRAVAIADGAVVSAQGGGGPIDTPAVMRQAGLMRMLCPFMSFALADFNRKMETVRGLEEWRQTGNSAITPSVAMRDFAFQWVMPVALTALMVSLGRDGELPEVEDYVWEALGFYSMGVPLVRDVARMAESTYSSDGIKGGRTPLMFAGVGNAIKGFGHAAKAIAEDDDRAAYLAIKETTNAVGFALGLGTPQIWRTIEGSQAYFVDDEGGVLAPLLGKPHPRKN